MYNERNKVLVTAKHLLKRLAIAQWHIASYNYLNYLYHSFGFRADPNGWSDGSLELPLLQLVRSAWRTSALSAGRTQSCPTSSLPQFHSTFHPASPLAPCRLQTNGHTHTPSDRQPPEAHTRKRTAGASCPPTTHNRIDRLPAGGARRVVQPRRLAHFPVFCQFACELVPRVGRAQRTAPGLGLVGNSARLRAARQRSSGR